MTPTPTWAGVAGGDVVQVTGKDRVDLLHRLSTQDLTPLATPGALRSTLFTTAQGRLIDWVTVIAAPAHLLLLTAPGRGERIVSWIDTYTIMEDVQTKLITSTKAHIVVDGPQADAAVASVLGGSAPTQAGEARDVGGTWTWRGLPAYGSRVELLAEAERESELIAAFQRFGAACADAETLDRLRVAAGVPGSATEYPDDVNPLELRLGPAAVSFRKGCYIGQEVISRLDSYDKVARLLVGFRVDRKPEPIPAGSEAKLTRDGRPFGRVTSLVPDTHGGAIGLAVVKREGSDAVDAELVIGESHAPVRLENRPFF